jgi:nickel-dependent lactate racemase
MQAHFAFGKTGLTVSLPPGPRYQVLTSRSAVALENPKSAIESALDQPIAGPPLRELAAGKKSVAIAVCDITRPAPNRQTLPPLLKQLHQAGIPPEAVTILIATGLHRAATPAELDVILGPEIAAHYRVENHHARRKEEQCPLGHTRRGTPVWIDARFIRADLRITLGFIEQHLMAGFS